MMGHQLYQVCYTAAHNLLASPQRAYSGLLKLLFLQVCEEEALGACTHRMLPSQQLSGELDIQADVLETLLSYLEVRAGAGTCFGHVTGMFQMQVHMHALLCSGGLMAYHSVTLSSAPPPPGLSLISDYLSLSQPCAGRLSSAGPRVSAPGPSDLSLPR